MQRVERHIILDNPEIDHICFLSKNLYNFANYHVRQEFFNNKKWLRYQDLDKLLKNSSDYKMLPAQTAQQTLRVLDKNWTSFFRSIKEYKKNGSLGKPNPPRYKHKEKGRSIVVFTNQQVKVKKGFVKFPKKTNLSPIKTNVEKLQQVRITPKATCCVLEVVYNREMTKEEENVKSKLKPDTYLSIDIGLNNLATCTNNIGEIPFIINGRILKSINQYFNKKKAEFMSFIEDRGTSKRIKRLTHKRNNKISDYLHKSSRFIVRYCAQHNISTIVVGKNKCWKQDINIGKRSNQNFVSVPFAVFIEQLEYKAEEVGIKVICHEESYTSKCSFLDLEPVKKHVKYAGRRIKRGLFKSARGFLINADINGSLNILRKVVPKVFSDGIEGVGLTPTIISLIH